MTPVHNCDADPLGLEAESIQGLMQPDGEDRKPEKELAERKVERIVHKHVGRVWVGAELDREGIFYFTLSGREPGPEGALAATGRSL
jgi:hypothetical protein